MNFLRRLAATALGETASLRPALPPMYAALKPEPEGSDALTPQRQQRSHAVPEPRPARPDASNRLPDTAPSAPTAFEPQPQGDKPAEAAPRALPALRTIDDHRGAAKPSPRGVRSTARSDRPLLATDAAARAASPPPTSIAPVVVAPSTPSRRALPAEPLTAAIVDAHRERTSSAAPVAPTVVQVTIDRIDVRAPAPTQQRPSKPSPARPAAASASLADYLRSRRS